MMRPVLERMFGNSPHTEASAVVPRGRSINFLSATTDADIEPVAGKGAYIRTTRLCSVHPRDRLPATGPEYTDN
jgi:hypothetical protein